MRPEAEPVSRLSNKRRKKTVSMQSPKTARRSFFPKINKIGASRIAKTSGHRTTTETIRISSNGGTTIQATTLTETR
jgi:hypothetical protein